MHAENDDDLDGGQRSSEVKWAKLCAMAAIFGQKKRWCKLRMMMIFMEVKDHQRSNEVNYVIWLPYLVKRIGDASYKNADDLHEGQRSSEVKYGNIMCHGYHIWSKELLMQVKNDDDLHGGQRSSEVKGGKLCYIP